MYLHWYGILHVPTLMWDLPCTYIDVGSSVTRFGDLLHFGQLFKAFGNNYFAWIAYILSDFCKGVEIFHFLVKSFLCNFYRHLVTFFWSHWWDLPCTYFDVRSLINVRIEVKLYQSFFVSVIFEPFICQSRWFQTGRRLLTRNAIPDVR